MIGKKELLRMKEEKRKAKELLLSKHWLDLLLLLFYLL
jgi:hypothetical protein